MSITRADTSIWVLSIAATALPIAGLWYLFPLVALVYYVSQGKFRSAEITAVGTLGIWALYSLSITDGLTISYLRDIALVSSVLLGYLSGRAVLRGRTGFPTFLRSSAWVAVASIAYFVGVLLAKFGSEFFAENVGAERVGVQPNVVLLAGFLIACRGGTLGRSRMAARAMIVLACFGILLSQSRTDLLVIGSAAICRFGMRAIPLAALAVAGIYAAGGWEPESPVAFVDRLLSSPEELLSSYESLDYGDMATHWRAFETGVALVYILGGTWVQQILGFGYGASVPLPYAAELGTGTYTSIPVFHNGFVYALFKMGLAGLALVIFLFIAFPIRALRGSESVQRAAIVTWFVFVAAATNFVVSSMFSPVFGGVLGLWAAFIYEWVRRDGANLSAGQSS